MALRLKIIFVYELGRTILTTANEKKHEPAPVGRSQCTAACFCSSCSTRATRANSLSGTIAFECTGTQFLAVIPLATRAALCVDKRQACRRRQRHPSAVCSRRRSSVPRSWFLRSRVWNKLLHCHIFFVHTALQRNGSARHAQVKLYFSNTLSLSWLHQVQITVEWTTMVINIAGLKWTLRWRSTYVFN